MTVLGVDIGATKIATGLVNGNAEVSSAPHHAHARSRGIRRIHRASLAGHRAQPHARSGSHRHLRSRPAESFDRRNSESAESSRMARRSPRPHGRRKIRPARAARKRLQRGWLRRGTLWSRPRLRQCVLHGHRDRHRMRNHSRRQNLSRKSRRGGRRRPRHHRLSQLRRCADAARPAASKRSRPVPPSKKQARTISMRSQIVWEPGSAES